MAVTAAWYGLGVKDQWNTVSGDRVNWTGDTIKTSLHTSSYTPVQDTDQYFNPHATNELSAGNGYTAGGYTLGSKQLTYDTGTNEVRMIAANASWTSASFTCRIAVTYKSTGTPSADHLLGFVNMGADQTVSSGTFTIQWDATGVLKVTANVPA